MARITVDHRTAAAPGSPPNSPPSSVHHHVPASAAAPARPGNRTGRLALPKVTVNGVAIDRKAIAAEMQSHRADDATEALQAAVTALVVREVLVQAARRAGVVARPEVDADGRCETEEDALIRALIAAEVAVPSAEDAELRRYYDNNRRRFLTAAVYEADHILIAARRDDDAAFAAARDKAAALRRDLEAAPQRFAELAAAHSDCPSGRVGGALGQIGAGETTPAFEAALAELQPGELSGPVETPYGVHLIRLNRRHDGTQLPYEAVRDRIADYLSVRVRRRAAAQYVGQLIEQAEIGGFAVAANALATR
jgi:peptidyl-prolyl cis-trans isomerase C